MVSTTSVSPSYLPIECPHPGVRITVGMSSPIHVDSAHQVILIEQQEHLVRGTERSSKMAKTHPALGPSEPCGITTGKRWDPSLGRPNSFGPLPTPGSLVFLLCPRLHLGLLRLLRHWRPPLLQVIRCKRPVSRRVRSSAVTGTLGGAVPKFPDRSGYRCCHSGPPGFAEV